MRDWSVEQLREIETAFRLNGQERRLYIEGQPHVVRSVLLMQPSYGADHTGKRLDIDALDPEGNMVKIRLYTSEWPEERRRG